MFLSISELIRGRLGSGPGNNNNNKKRISMLYKKGIKRGFIVYNRRNKMKISTKSKVFIQRVLRNPPSKRLKTIERILIIITKNNTK